MNNNYQWSCNRHWPKCIIGSFNCMHLWTVAEPLLFLEPTAFSFNHAITLPVKLEINSKKEQISQDILFRFTLNLLCYGMGIQINSTQTKIIHIHIVINLPCTKRIVQSNHDGDIDPRHGSHVRMIYDDRRLSNPYIIGFYLGLFEFICWAWFSHC